MGRNELLGLCWHDLDTDKATLSINREVVAIGYDLHETRGKTVNARRRIDPDPTTISVLDAWRAWQTVELRQLGPRLLGEPRGLDLDEQGHLREHHDEVHGLPVTVEIDLSVDGRVRDEVGVHADVVLEHRSQLR